MFEIKIIQSSEGCYNLVDPSEKTYVFKMAIYQDKKIYQVGKLKAILEFSGDVEEKYSFEEPIENLSFTFEKCIEYCSRVFSSVDMKNQALFFAKTYLENYEEINTNYLNRRKAAIEKEIARLKKDLTRLPDLGDITWETNSFIDNRIALLDKWITETKQEQSQIVKDSSLYNKKQSKIDSYESKKLDLLQYKIS